MPIINNLKSSKGSTAVYVTIVILSMLIILLTLFFISNSVRQNQLATAMKIKETYEVDNEKYRGLFSFALITNANRVAGINNFYKDIKLDDNKFEVLLCNITKLKDIVKTLYFFALYDASKIPGN